MEEGIVKGLKGYVQGKDPGLSLSLGGSFPCTSENHRQEKEVENNTEVRVSSL